jgi:hypothetical protein
MLGQDGPITLEMGGSVYTETGGSVWGEILKAVIKIADAPEVTVDFMIGKTSLEIDTGALKRLEKLSRLPDDAKKQVFLVVDALICDFKAKQAYAS